MYFAHSPAAASPPPTRRVASRCAKHAGTMIVRRAFQSERASERMPPPPPRAAQTLILSWASPSPPEQPPFHPAHFQPRYSAHMIANTYNGAGLPGRRVRERGGGWVVFAPPPPIHPTPPPPPPTTAERLDAVLTRAGKAGWFFSCLFCVHK